MSKTEEQIIQALETCQTDKACTSCPYYAPTNMKCISQLASDASSLIKELKEEKENLIRNYANCQKEFLKKFADALKSKSELVAPSVYAVPYRAVSVEDIDNLVKEMTGGENDA